MNTAFPASTLALILPFPVSWGHISKPNPMKQVLVPEACVSMSEGSKGPGAPGEAEATHP